MVKDGRVRGVVRIARTHTNDSLLSCLFRERIFLAYREREEVSMSWEILATSMKNVRLTVWVRSYLGGKEGSLG